MTYTQDWFSHNIPVWKSVLSHLIGKKTLSYLEIGCFEGRATVWFYENIAHQSEKKHLDVIDTFEGSEEHSPEQIGNLYGRFVENTSHLGYDLTVFQGKSHNMLRLLISEYDVIYIDGSHKSKDVLLDAILAWPILKKGGILIFDDYAWKGFKEEMLNPKKGIDFFLEAYKDEYELLHMGWQVIIKKKE